MFINNMNWTSLPKTLHSYIESRLVSRLSSNYRACTVVSCFNKSEMSLVIFVHTSGMRPRLSIFTQESFNISGINCTVSKSYILHNPSNIHIEIESLLVALAS